MSERDDIKKKKESIRKAAAGAAMLSIMAIPLFSSQFRKYFTPFKRSSKIESMRQQDPLSQEIVKFYQFINNASDVAIVERQKSEILTSIESKITKLEKSKELFKDDIYKKIKGYKNAFSGNTFDDVISTLNDSIDSYTKINLDAINNPYISRDELSDISRQLSYKNNRLVMIKNNITTNNLFHELAKESRSGASVNQILGKIRKEFSTDIYGSTPEVTFSNMHSFKLEFNTRSFNYKTNFSPLLTHGSEKKTKMFASLFDTHLMQSGIPLENAAYIANEEKKLLNNTSYKFQNKEAIVEQWTKKSYDNIRSITSNDFNREMGRFYTEINKYKKMNRIGDIKMDIQPISNSTLLHFNITTLSDKPINDIQSGKILGDGKLSFTISIPKNGVLQRHAGAIGTVQSPLGALRNQINQIIGNLPVGIKNSLSNDSMKRLSSKHYFEDQLTQGFAGNISTGNALTDWYNLTLKHTKLTHAKANFPNFEKNIKDAFNMVNEARVYSKKNPLSKTHYLDYEFDSAKGIISQVSIITYDGKNRKAVSIYNTEYNSLTDRYQQDIAKRGKLKSTDILEEKRIALRLKNSGTNKYLSEKEIAEYINKNISSNDIIFSKSPFMKGGDYAVSEKLFETHGIRNNPITQIKAKGNYKDTDILMRGIDNLDLDDNFANLSRAGETYKHRIQNLYKSVYKYNPKLADKMKAKAVSLERRFLNTSTLFQKKEVDLLHSALYDTVIMAAHENMVSTLVEEAGGSFDTFKDIFKLNPDFIKLLSVNSPTSSNAALQEKVNAIFGGLIVPFYQLKGSVLDKAHQMMFTTELEEGYKGWSRPIVPEKNYKRQLNNIKRQLPFATEAFNKVIAPQQKQLTRLNVGYILGVTPFSTDGSAFFSSNSESIIQNTAMMGPEKLDIVVDSTDLKVGDNVYSSKIKARGVKKDFGMYHGAPLYNEDNNIVRITSITENNGVKTIGYRTLYNIGEETKANLGASESITLRKKISMSTFDIITEGSFMKRGNYQQIIQVLLGRVNLVTEGHNISVLEARDFINRDKVLSQYMKASLVSSPNGIKPGANTFLTIEIKNNFDIMKSDQIGSDIINSIGKLYTKLGINNNSAEKRVVENLFELNGSSVKNVLLGDVKNRYKIIAQDFTNNIRINGVNQDTMKAFSSFFEGALSDTTISDRERSYGKELIRRTFRPHTLPNEQLRIKALNDMPKNFARLLSIKNMAFPFDLARLGEDHYVTTMGTSTYGGFIFDEIMMQTHNLKAKISPLSLFLLKLQKGSDKMLEYYNEQLNLNIAKNFHKNIRRQIMDGTAPAQGENLNKLFKESPELESGFKNLMENSTIEKEIQENIENGKYLNFQKMTTRRVKRKADGEVLMRLASLSNINGGLHYTTQEGKTFQFFNDDFLLRSISRKGDRTRGIITEESIALYNLMIGKSADNVLDNMLSIRASKEAMRAELPAMAGRVEYGVEIQDRIKNGIQNLETVYNPKESLYVNEVLINRRTFDRHKESINSMIKNMDIEDLRSHFRYLKDYGRTIGSANSRPHQMWVEVLKGKDGQFSTELDSFSKNSEKIFKENVSFTSFVDDLLANNKQFSEIQYKQAYMHALENGLAPLTTLGQKMPASQSSIISPLISFFRNIGNDAPDAAVKTTMKISRFSTLKMKADTDGDILTAFFNKAKGFFDWLKGSYSENILNIERTDSKEDVFIGYLHDSFKKENDLATGLYYDKIDKSVYQAKVGGTGKTDDFLSMLKVLNKNINKEESYFMKQVRNAAIKGNAGETFKYVFSAQSILNDAFQERESLRYINDGILAGYIPEIGLAQRKKYSNVGKAISYLQDLQNPGSEKKFRELLATEDSHLEKFKYLLQDIADAPQEIKNVYASHMRKNVSDIDFSKIDKLQILSSYNKEYKGFGKVYSTSGKFNWSGSKTAILENLYALSEKEKIDFLSEALYKRNKPKSSTVNTMAEKSGMLKYGILAGTALFLLSNLGSHEQGNNTNMFATSNDERNYTENMEHGFDFGDNRIRLMGYNYNQRSSDSSLVDKVFRSNNVSSVAGQDRKSNFLTF